MGVWPLVQAPATQWRYGAYTDQVAHAKAMSAMGTYINMNGMAGLNDTLDFYDAGHLNQQGVEVFNRALLDSLAHRGLLPAPVGRP